MLAVEGDREALARMRRRRRSISQARTTRNPVPAPASVGRISSSGTPPT
jgi:hypothetical protein